MPRETENFLANLRLVCEPYGSITRLAKRAEVSAVTIHKVLAEKQVPSLVISERIAHAAGLQLRSMLLDPVEFEEILNQKTLKTNKSA